MKMKAVLFLIANCNIRLAWIIYVIVLQKYGGAEAHDWRFDVWQHKAIFEIFDNKIVNINRCRSGSKTRDMAALCVFFRIRGLIVVWLAGNRKQLMRAQIYWNEIIFIKKSSVSINKDMIYLINGDFFQIFVLKKGLQNDRGPRAHCIFYDEMAIMSKDLVENTRAFSGGMDYDGSPIFWIHFSTPEINTIFHECCNTYHTITHDCYSPSWFSAQYIEMIRKDLAPQKFKQEMECEFVSMAGSILEGHIHKGICPVPLTDWEYYGHDPNAREGYCIVGAKYSSDYKYAQFFFAKNFGPNSNGKRLALEFLKQQELTGKVKGIEMETNGVGLPIYDDYIAEYNGNAEAMHWDQLQKIRRVNQMCKCHYYIDTTESKEFAQLYTQLMSLSLTQKGDAIDKPSDKQWHFADSGMHAAMDQGIIWT